MRKHTPDIIGAPGENQVLVISTNAEGVHKKGIALLGWRRWGAVHGQSEGAMGRCYGIITKKNWRIPRSSSLQEIYVALCKFAVHALSNPQTEFLMPLIGTQNAGYTVEQIRSVFVKVHESCHPFPDNVILPKEFEMRS